MRIPHCDCLAIGRRALKLLKWTRELQIGPSRDTRSVRAGLDCQARQLDAIAIYEVVCITHQIVEFRRAE